MAIGKQKKHFQMLGYGNYAIWFLITFVNKIISTKVCKYFSTQELCKINTFVICKRMRNLPAELSRLINTQGTGDPEWIDILSQYLPSIKLEVFSIDSIRNVWIRVTPFMWLPTVNLSKGIPYCWQVPEFEVCFLVLPELCKSLSHGPDELEWIYITHHPW